MKKVVIVDNQKQVSLLLSRHLLDLLLTHNSHTFIQDYQNSKSSMFFL